MQPGTADYQLWKTCFPHADMEAFAQATLPPFSTNPYWKAQKQNFTSTQRWDCRKKARQMVAGGKNKRVAPHMQFNYQYHANHTIYRYPEKEVFVIRYNQEYEDMELLNAAMGGGGGNTNTTLRRVQNFLARLQS